MEASWPTSQMRMRMLLVRGVMLACFLAVMAWMFATHLLSRPQAPLGAALGWVAVSPPLVWTGRFPRWSSRADIQLMADVLLLTILLYFTGGPANPLVSFYLFPVLIAGLILPRKTALLIGAMVITGYALLIRFHAPLPEMPAHGANFAHGFQLHLIGMCLTFVITVAILLGVVLRMSEERRMHELQLAELRQQSIRDRNMLALGAQAASDAHELGTPINTMMLLLEGWRPRSADDAERLHRLRHQLEHCRRVLARLGSRANALCQPDPPSCPLTELVAGAVAQWRNLNPEGGAVRLEQRSDLPPPLVRANPLLEQALFVLLDNARDAGATCVAIDLDWNDAMARIRVTDDGPGFSAGLLPLIGREPIRHRAHGKGLGLYVLRYMLESVGGGLKIANDGVQGARIEIDYPVREGV